MTVLTEKPHIPVLPKEDVTDFLLQVGGKLLPGSHLSVEQPYDSGIGVRHILEDAGSSWNNIVDVTVFLTNMKDDFQAFNRLYAEYFKDNQPCRTTLEISSLPTPIAIELKVVATID